MEYYIQRDIKDIKHFTSKPCYNIVSSRQKLFSNNGLNNAALSTTLVSYDYNPWKVEHIRIMQPTFSGDILKFCQCRNQNLKRCLFLGHCCIAIGCRHIL